MESPRDRPEADRAAVSLGRIGPISATVAETVTECRQAEANKVAAVDSEVAWEAVAVPAVQRSKGDDSRSELV